MNKRLPSNRLFIYILVAIFLAAFSSSLKAQVPSQPKIPAQDRAPLPPIKPAPDRVPSSPPELTEKQPGSPLARRRGLVSLVASQGVQIRVDNRTAGRITVHGWDRDVIEARATSERGDETLLVGQAEDNGPPRFFLKADYANLDNPEDPTKALEFPPLNGNGPIPVNLEVNVPRYAEIEIIKVIRSDVEITGVETALSILGKGSNITLRDVGSVEAHTRTGWIAIENARGIADVTSSTGKIGISNSRGAVRAVSITGTIEIRCFKGRVDVSNTEGPIELKSIDGDVDADATNSDIRLTSPLSDDGRFYMRSMSGRVETIIPADTRGFNVTLTSYRGTVASDFSLRATPAAPRSRPIAAHGPRSAGSGGSSSSPTPQVLPPESQDTGTAKSRLAGRFGKGGPQITLDSFQGAVKVSRVARNSIEPCN